MGANPSGDTFNIKTDQGLLKGWGFNPWQDNFIISMNKLYFEKPI
jgi:hypothetical protein